MHDDQRSCRASRSEGADDPRMDSHWTYTGWEDKWQMAYSV